MEIEVELLPQEAVRLPDGRELRGPGALYAAARRLIAAGADPNTRMVARRGDVVALTGTVDDFGRQVWRGAKRDPASGPWRPRPGEKLAPALVRWAKKIGAWSERQADTPAHRKGQNQSSPHHEALHAVGERASTNRGVPQRRAQ